MLDLHRITEAEVLGHAKYLRDRGHPDIAALLAALWGQLCHARVSPPVTVELPPEASLPGISGTSSDVSLAFLRTILTEIEPPDRMLWMTIEDDRPGRRRSLRMCNLGQLQTLATIAMERIAGGTLACDGLPATAELTDGDQGEAR